MILKEFEEHSNQIQSLISFYLSNLNLILLHECLVWDSLAK